MTIPFTPLTTTISIAPQIDADDIRRAAAMGIRTIVSNRPDSEEDNPVPAAELAAIAKAHGIAFHHVPVIGFEVTDQDSIDAVATVLERVEEPVLLFCRTGTRSALLWAQIAVRELGVAAVEAIAARAGQDISVIEDELIALSMPAAVEARPLDVTATAA